MGDRANVYVHEGDKPGVYLYTHWEGGKLPGIVKDVLSTSAAQRRLNDTAYLTRIIFSWLIQDSVLDETGYGISAEIPDGGDRIVDIDTWSGTIAFTGWGDYQPRERVPIKSYVESDQARWK